MLKFAAKLQPPKNFKYKFLFWVKIPQGDVPSTSSYVGLLAIQPESSSIGVPIIELEFTHAIEVDCVVLDLVVAKGDIELSKERKKTYELNRHFQDTWALKLPREKCMLGVGGKVV
jgi:hypothetical protein